MTRMLTLLAAALFALPVAAVELGDDGLHKTDWMRDTFKDLREDLADANAEGKRLMVIIEQRGCIYCTKMHEEVFPRPEIADFIRDNFFVVLYAVDSVPARRGGRGSDSRTGSGGDDARCLWPRHHVGPAHLGAGETVLA